MTAPAGRGTTCGHVCRKPTTLPLHTLRKRYKGNDTRSRFATNSRGIQLKPFLHREFIAADTVYARNSKTRPRSRPNNYKPRTLPHVIIIHCQCTSSHATSARDMPHGLHVTVSTTGVCRTLRDNVSWHRLVILRDNVSWDQFAMLQDNVARCICTQMLSRQCCSVLARTCY